MNGFAELCTISTEWALYKPSFPRLLARAEKCASGEWQPDQAQQPRVSAGVAILPVIGETTPRGDMFTVSTMRLDAQFREAMRSPAIGAVLLEVDSPGGVVYYTDQLARRIQESRGQKPIVALVNGMCASAAFWIASAADKLFMAPGSDIGSVGVWCAHVDQSAMFEQSGQKVTLISAGKYKTEASPFGPLDDDARMYLQGRVDAQNEDFINALARNRGVTPTTVKRDFGEGRIFSAKEGVSRGMADGVQLPDKVLRDLAGRRPSKQMVADADVLTSWMAASEVTFKADLLDAMTVVASFGDPDVLRRRLALKEKQG